MAPPAPGGPSSWPGRGRCRAPPARGGPAPRPAPTAAPGAARPAPVSRPAPARRGSALPPSPGRARRPSPRRSGRWRCASRSVYPALRGAAGGAAGEKAGGLLGPGRAVEARRAARGWDRRGAVVGGGGPGARERRGREVCG